MNHQASDFKSVEEMNQMLPAFTFQSMMSSSDENAVYSAVQNSLDRQVAIKLLSPVLSADTRFRESFETHARLMARLNHPNLISVFDFGMVEGMLYLVMEFVPGKSLQRSATGNCIEQEQALNLLDQICQGLIHAHQNGVLHGSLNLDSILLTPKVEPKIGNFGSMLNSGMMNGATVAPEMKQPGAVATVKADIYAIGAILFELLTSRPHRDGRPAPSTYVTCSPAVDQIWAKATAVDPDRRYASLLAMHDAVQRAMQGGAAEVSEKKASKKSSSKKSSAKTGGGSGVSGKRDMAKNGPKPPMGGGMSPRVPVAPGSPVPVAVKAPTGPLIADSSKSKAEMIRNVIVVVVLAFGAYKAWDYFGADEPAPGPVKRPNAGQTSKPAKAPEKAAEPAGENPEEVVKKPAEPAKVDDLQKVLQEARALAQSGAKTATDLSGEGEKKAEPAPEGEVVESAVDGLTRLRDALAQGVMTEMPKGSVAKKDRTYLFVDKKMSWPDAVAFAEKHGAHLAEPTADASIKWMLDKVAGGKEFWVGIAKRGESEWGLSDGKNYQGTSKPTGIGSYVNVDPTGALRVNTGKTQLPFILEWHQDGTNPGSLKAQFKAAKDSMGGKSPQFPLGTRVFNQSAFLYVAQPMTWAAADEVARNAGGSLATLSTSAEASFVADLVESVDAPDGIWLGACLKQNQWTWVTGESWQHAKWGANAANTEAGSALILLPLKDWHARKQDKEATGFVIEWSPATLEYAKKEPSEGAAGKDQGGTKPAVTGKTTVEQLNAKAKSVLDTVVKKRDKELDSNVRKFNGDLDAFVRTMPKAGQDVWQPKCESIKEMVQGNRVPTSLPKEEGAEANKGLNAIISYCAKKQKQADDDFKAATGKLHVAYLAKLREMVGEEKRLGQALKAEELEGMIKENTNLGVWLSNMGVGDAEPSKPKSGEQEKPVSPDFPQDPAPVEPAAGEKPPVMDEFPTD